MASKTVTQLLLEWKSGNAQALDDLMPLVYDELHRLAGRYMRRERPDHTLQPTALVSEAFLRMVDQKQLQWQSRAHFYGIAARLMREILIEHARSRNASKRGGGAVRVTLSGVADMAKDEQIELVALDKALTKLAEIDPQKARLVELRFFAGLTIEETAEVLETSSATIIRQWRVARAWIYREMKEASQQ